MRLCVKATSKLAHQEHNCNLTMLANSSWLRWTRLKEARNEKSSLIFIGPLARPKCHHISMLCSALSGLDLCSANGDPAAEWEEDEEEKQRQL